MKIYALLFSLASASVACAQTTEPSRLYTKSYFASASELILSAGDLGNVAISSPVNQLFVLGPQYDAKTIPRFSAFFHFGEQFHFNFSNSLGFYTGIGLRNLGMINRINDSLKVKQRVYSLGVPLAFKLGNMGRRSYIALGAEAEFFFHYKQKVFKGTSGRGEKIDKMDEWLSNRTNLFNPSVFLELHFSKGTYMRLRYYLNDFLIPGNQSVRLNGADHSFTNERSTLFALSVGKILKKKKS